MATTSLTPEERSILLKLARQAIQAAAQGQPPPQPDLASLPPALSEPGATFVTLTRRGQLRGCIGSLVPHRTLADDITHRRVSD